MGEINMRDQTPFNYEQALKKIKDKFHFDFIALALVQSAELRYVLKWEHVLGNKSDRYKRIVLQSGKGIAGNVFKTGKPFLVENVESEIGQTHLFNYPILIAESLTSFGAIPLYKDNRVKGVLLVAFRDDRGVTPDLFEQFKSEAVPTFSPYYHLEMVEE